MNRMYLPLELKYLRCCSRVLITAAGGWGGQGGAFTGISGGTDHCTWRQPIPQRLLRAPSRCCCPGWLISCQSLTPASAATARPLSVACQGENAVLVRRVFDVPSGKHGSMACSCRRPQRSSRRLEVVVSSRTPVVRSVEVLRPPRFFFFPLSFSGLRGSSETLDEGAMATSVSTGEHERIDWTGRSEVVDRGTGPGRRATPQSH